VREIIIKIGDEGELSVWEGDLTTERLAWDEMLGQIAEMTHPMLNNKGHYMMMTQADWEKRWPKSGVPATGGENPVFREVDEKP
jgi:hypothetical protein